MSGYALLSSIDINNEIIDISNASPYLVKEIQQRLAESGFYEGSIDGITGSLTKKALADFKKARWLESSTIIGRFTARSLLEGIHPVSEQTQQVRSVPGGVKTGRSMYLPTGEVVYSGQSIVSGIPLTWGEFTKNCTRIPESNDVVQAIIRFTKGFGEIREKWGKPIFLTSGYRPVSVNRAVGGARFSRHIVGDAGDILSGNGDIYELLEVVKASTACGIGLGMHKGFIHVDYRPSGRVVFSY